MNGAKGKCPVLPSEFRSLGLDSDLRCFQLVVYLYRRVLDPNRWDVYNIICQLRCHSLHEQAVPDAIKPGTLMHVGDKFLQMCATNSTTGGHRNTLPEDREF